MKYGLYLLTLTLFLVACQSLPPAPVVPPESADSPAPTIIPSQPSQPIESKKPLTSSRVIDITTRNWAFSPASILVTKGEKVTLRLTGESGVHGFAVPDFGINKTVRPGETITVDLPTEKAGSYRFFCSIACGEGHIGMNGTITVKE